MNCFVTQPQQQMIRPLDDSSIEQPEMSICPNPNVGFKYGCASGNALTDTVVLRICLHFVEDRSLLNCSVLTEDDGSYCL